MARRSASAPSLPGDVVRRTSFSIRRPVLTAFLALARSQVAMPKLIDRLLSEGASEEVSAPPFPCMQPPSLAPTLCCCCCVQLASLLRGGLSIETRDSRGDTLLLRACGGKSFDVVETLIEQFVPQHSPFPQ